MATAARASAPELIRTFKEIIDEYPDHWVLIAVTAMNDQHEPCEGVLIRQSRRRFSIVAPTKKYQADNPEARMFSTFHTSVFRPWAPDEDDW